VFSNKIKGHDRAESEEDFEVIHLERVDLGVVEKDAQQVVRFNSLDS